MNTEAVYDHLPGDETRSILPGQIMRTLTRRWLLLLMCALIGGVLGLLAASQMTQTYTASGDIVIDEKSFAIPEIQGAISGQGSPDLLPGVRTAALEMRSPALLEAVVNELHLTDSEYFNPDLRKLTLFEAAMKKVHEIIALLLPSTPGEKGNPTTLAADELAKRLTIFYDNRSLVVTASVILPDPRLATSIVNSILNRYIAQRGDTRVRYNAAANAAIRQQLAEVRQQVDALDAEARDLRAKNQLVIISPSGSLGQQRLSQLGTIQAQDNADLQQLESRMALATQLTQQGRAADLADVLSSQTISRLRDQQAVVAQRLAKFDATAMPGSRLRQGIEAESKQVQKQIADEARRIVKSLGDQVTAARDRVKAADHALEVAAASAGQSSLIQAQIEQVEKEATSRRQVYQALLERASQTSVSPEMAKQSPGVYIGSPAIIPIFPSGPHTKIVAALGMLAGLMFGSVIAVKRGTDVSFAASPDEIASYAHVPLLGVIPLSRRQQLKGTNDGGGLAASPEQDEALGLLYARLRHQAAQRGNELRSVLFISADGEDNAFLAREFADLATREGERVLLIDTGAEQSTAETPSANNGLMAVLNGQQAWQDALVHDASTLTNTLPVEVGGALARIDRNAATRLRSMLREAADDYTLIVITSGLSPRSVQASHLVQSSDFTLLVVNSSRSRPSAVMAAVEHLASMKSNVGLAVVTRRTG